MAKATIVYRSEGFKTVNIFTMQPVIEWSDRALSTYMDLLYPVRNNKGEITKMAQSSWDTLISLVEEGYVEAKATCPVGIKVSAADQKMLQSLRKNLSKDLRESLVLSKTNFLEFDIGKEQPFRLDMDAVIKTTEKLSKGIKPVEPIGAANRRWLLIQLANPVRIAKGLKPITEWRRELRSYDDKVEMFKDIVRLNEDEETGKQKTSIQEKLRSAFKLSDKGVRERDFGPIFVKRGVVQLMGTVTKDVTYVGYMDPDFAKEVKEAICSGTLSLTQNHLKALRELRLACEHSDFSRSFSSATFLGTGKVADPIAVKANILNNPARTAEPLKDWFTKVRDPNYQPPQRIKGMPRETVRNLAAKLDDEDSRGKLMLAISDNDADGVAKELEALGKLVEPVFFRDKEGNLTGRPLVQEDIDQLMAGKPGYPKKKGSSRNKKAS